MRERSAKPKKDLTVEQFKRFMEALRDDVAGTKYEAVYYVAMFQYLIYGRIQDAAALAVDSFDFENNKIHVNRKVQWIRKAGFEDRIVDGSKKNGGKTLEMPEHAGPLLREWQMKSCVRQGQLFMIDGKIIKYRTIEHRYTKALQKAGLPFRATHILRHAALTEYYQACRDLLATAEVAGQSDTRSTQRYAKVRDESLARTQREIDGRLAGILDLQAAPALATVSKRQHFPET